MRIYTVVKGAVSLFAFLCLLGCSIRPDTQEMTGLDAARIAQALRCEMRDAWIGLLQEAIVRDGANKDIAAGLGREHFLRFVPATTGGKLTPVEYEVARADNEARTFERFLKTGYKRLHDSEIDFVVEKYSDAYIGYKFIFDITQTNAIGAGVDLLSVVSRGTLTTSIGGSFSGKRQSTREFVLADRVDRLLTNRPTIRKCNEYRSGVRPANGAYPIAGKLNLVTVVRSFIAANQSGNLIGQFADVDLLTSGDKPPVPSMSETLIFTTILHGGIDPKLELSPRLRGTSVKEAGLTASSDRIDMHKLVLVMQLPSSGGMTVAEERNAAEVGQRNKQIRAIANELRRLDDRDENSKILDLITGQ